MSSNYVIHIGGGCITADCDVQTPIEILDAIAAHNQDPNAHPNGIAGGEGGSSRIAVPFAFGDATPKTIATLAAGTTVFTAQIVITIPFNGVSPQLRLGDSLQLDRLITVTEVDPTIACEFSTNPAYTFSVSTAILLSITPGAGATTGAGFVLLEV